MSRPGYNDSIFINCPFDDDYKPILRAIIYAIYRCGFFPQTALDEDDGTEIRLLKIIHKMRNCRYGVHDLSRIELNPANLPRFNMPFELGVFFGAKHFGDAAQNRKNALILERDKYVYQQFVSGLNGIDTIQRINFLLPELAAETQYTVDTLPFLNLLDIVQEVVTKQLA